MRWTPALVLAAVAWGLIPVRVSGQELLYHQPQILDPRDVGAPNVLLLPDPGLAPAPEPPPVVRRPAGVRGIVGGFGQNSHANASVGFTYLVPFWSFQAFQLAVPKHFESQFPVFGTTGTVDSEFAYAPRVNLDYYVDEIDATIGASGTFLSLSGRIDRQAGGTTGPAGQLTANANLTLVSANLVEFGRQYAFSDLFPRKAEHKGLADTIVDLRIGTRYVSVDQNYTGTVTSSGVGTPGSAITNRFSTQTFRGIGLTSAMTWEIPYGTNWAFYSTTRLSVLLGDNRRNSSISVAVPGQPAFADVQFENRTLLVPVTELEMGAEWGEELAVRLREGLPMPQFVVRVAGVGQYWGGLGPLSAGDSRQKFRDTDLFLVGGYIQAGFRY